MVGRQRQLGTLVVRSDGTTRREERIEQNGLETRRPLHLTEPPSPGETAPPPVTGCDGGPPRCCSRSPLFRRTTSVSFSNATKSAGVMKFAINVAASIPKTTT